MKTSNKHMSQQSDAASLEKQFEGLYQFVRSHLMVFNAIVLTSGFVVASIDVFAPRFRILPQIVYLLTTTVFIVCIAAALSPQAFGRMLSAFGVTVEAADPRPLWKRPLWQCVVTLMAVVSLCGFGTVARADNGGLLGSYFVSVRELQTAAAQIETDTENIGQQMMLINQKLDELLKRSGEHELPRP